MSNVQVENVLERLEEGVDIKLKIKKDSTRVQDGEEEILELTVTNVPPNAKRSVVHLWDSDADLDRDKKELLKDGYKHVSLQPVFISRRNSQPISEDYGYEVRDLMNKDIDASSVVDIEIV
jgi:hypothetical protein